jgi:hypothetical protein
MGAQLGAEVGSPSAFALGGTPLVGRPWWDALSLGMQIYLFKANCQWSRFSGAQGWRTNPDAPGSVALVSVIVPSGPVHCRKPSLSSLSRAVLALSTTASFSLAELA